LRPVAHHDRLRWPQIPAQPDLSCICAFVPMKGAGLGDYGSALDHKFGFRTDKGNGLALSRFLTEQPF